MPTRLFAPLALVPVLAMLPLGSALADCVPAGTAGDDSIICTGADADGVDAGAGTDSVTVESGATVDGAVNLGTGAGDNATNTGSVTTTGDAANGMLDVGDDDVLTNSGIIDTGGFDADGLRIDGIDGTAVNAADGGIRTTSSNSDGSKSTAAAEPT